jgi:uncharacterized protein YbjQ (UPF0145 family)
MRFFGLTKSDPYLSRPRGLANPRPDLFRSVHYQIVPSPRAMPMAQVSLDFRQDVRPCANPDMTLTVLVDRSGSMAEAFAEGHVYNVTSAILNYVAPAGVGFDLIFYDDRVSDAGHITNFNDLNMAIQMNGPRGGTQVALALRQATAKQGKYVIVITDGEFADKDKARQIIIQDLLPKVTPENPYAYRLHFVGAGEGVDHAFLRQIEADAIGQGIPLVTQHHHAHLSHSHVNILQELDRAFLGAGLKARFGEAGLVTGEDLTAGGMHTIMHTITHTSDAATRRGWDGGVGDLGFLPRRAVLGCEYPLDHSSALGFTLYYQDAHRQMEHVTFSIPLPKTAPAPDLAPSKKPGFHLPWFHHSPEEEAAKAAEAARREELRHKIAEVRSLETQRQSRDLVELTSGRIPIMAVERLKEIDSSADASQGIFTSNLDPDEAALLRREGCRVRGIVTGSAVYHVGQAYASSYQDCEVTVLSEAYNTATWLAVNRMQQELRLIGAHGVVGVRLSLVRHEWAEKTIEVQVVGTAIEAPGSAPAEPWSCDLSGTEWWALHRAGYVPAGLVWGHCTWFVLTTAADEMNEQSYYNTELTHWSAALGHARKRAMAHLKQQARHAHAVGVAGVRIERRLDEIRLSGPGEDPAYEREHHNLVLSIIGTAIKLRPDAPAGVRPTRQVLSLRDGRMTPVGVGVQDAEIE